MKVSTIIPHLFVFLCTIQPLYAQSLQGNIIDEDRAPLPYINVALYLSKDSTLTTGTISNERGMFVIKNIEQGDYKIKLSSVGYKTQQIDVHVQNEKTINIENITLKQDNITLNEIIIKAKQNPLSVDKGKFILNVNKSALKEQATIFDVLSFLPGVLLSGNNISVLGKGTPLILLNGREVHSIAEVEVLDPKQIKDISVDTHPSAEYNSQYNSVIHITTVNALKDQISSQVFHTSKFARNYSDREGANVNIQLGKWSHFLSYQIKDYRSKDRATNKYELYNADTYSLISNNSSYNCASGHSLAQNVILSTNYKFNEKNNLSLQYFLDTDNNHDRANTDEKTILGNKVIAHATDQKIKDQSQLHNIETMFTHQYADDNSLILTGGYIYSKDELKNHINTDETALNLIDGNNKYNVVTLKADYIRNIFKNYKLQVGGKFVNSRNSGYSNSFDPASGSFYYQNKTTLKDGTLAGYVTIDRQFKNFYASIGLRGEYISSNYRQDGEVAYTEHEFTLYPSINFEYIPNQKLIFLGGYSNKSSRPSFNQLSPIIYYINAMLYEQGNPLLKPMSQHNIYIACVLNNKFSVEASYTYRKNFSMYTFQSNPLIEGSLINSPININSSYYLLTSSYSDKWGIYRFSYNGSILYDVTRIPYLGSKDNVLHPKFSLSTVNQFDLYKQTMLFCNFDIASSFTSLGSKVKPVYNLALGIMQTFFKNKRLKITISANDLLRRSEADITRCINNVHSQAFLDNDSRNITISIKYNLNNFKNIFQKNNGNEEEINRITR